MSPRTGANQIQLLAKFDSSNSVPLYRCSFSPSLRLSPGVEVYHQTPAYITTVAPQLLSLILGSLTHRATLTPSDLPQFILKSSQAPLLLRP